MKAEPRIYENKPKWLGAREETRQNGNVWLRDGHSLFIVPERTYNEWKKRVDAC